MTDTPKPAPATPAATPLREANQQRVDAQRESEIPAGLIEELDRQVHGNDSGWHACVLCGCPERGAHFPTCIVAKMRQRESEQPEQALRRQVELAIIRYQILLNRMKACGGDHGVSNIEVPGWISEAKAALSPQTDSQ
jgi:hypothetical protein